MAKLYVTEYAGIAYIGGNGVPVPMEPPIASDVLDTGSGVDTSNTFNTNTTLVKITADGTLSYRFGATATTSHDRLIAGQSQYHGVRNGSGLTVSAITNT